MPEDVFLITQGCPPLLLGDSGLHRWRERVFTPAQFLPISAEATNFKRAPHLEGTERKPMNVREKIMSQRGKDVFLGWCPLTAAQPTRKQTGRQSELSSVEAGRLGDFQRFPDS